MRLHRLSLALFGLFLLAPAANAAIVFDTNSTADQTLRSDLLPGGSLVLHSTGTQHFTLDLASGVANVTSDFHDPDPFPAPDGPQSYLLYNTATTGTVVDNGGSYTIHYSLLFELKITSGVLSGVVFETKDDAVFEGTVASLPFPPNSVFGDPNRPDDAVTLYLKADPNGVLASLNIPIGAPVGSSLNRTVTTLNVIPEPTSLVMLGLGCAGLIGCTKRRSAHGTA